MTKTWFAVSALGLALGATSGGIAAKAYAAPAPLPAAASQYQDGQGRWDEPPSEYRDAGRQGFHDGIEAAHRDFETRSHKDADDHDRYRHPNVEREFVDDYRHAFKEGYSRAMHHLKEERHDEGVPQF
jgi:hypothetical protein